jgi:soluble P-type ATPase
MEMGNNAVFDATDTRWEYITTNTAQRYLQDGSSGSHQWFTAASGTAGNAITFTQAMTLTAAGKLFVNTTSGFIGVSNVKVDVGGRYNSGISGVGSYSFGAADGGGAFVINDTSNGSTEVERARIDSSGNLLIGDTSGYLSSRVLVKTTSTDSSTNALTLRNSASTDLFRVRSDGYTYAGFYAQTTASAANVTIASGGDLLRSTSALKYKQDVRDLENIDVGLFRAVRYKSKCQGDDQTKDYFGIIADEVADAGIEELVTRGENGEVEGFQYERLTVVLLKEIQSLRKRLADAGI